VANYILIALLMRISDEGAKAIEEAGDSLAQPGERPMVPAER
jgi:hypothetical protein